MIVNTRRRMLEAIKTLASTFDILSLAVGLYQAMTKSAFESYIPTESSGNRTSGFPNCT
jgi:hypothetical protein